MRRYIGGAPFALARSRGAIARLRAGLSAADAAIEGSSSGKSGVGRVSGSPWAEVPDVITMEQQPPPDASAVVPVVQLRAGSGQESGASASQQHASCGTAPLMSHAWPIVIDDRLSAIRMRNKRRMALSTSARNCSAMRTVGSPALTPTPARQAQCRPPRACSRRYAPGASSFPPAIGNINPRG